MASENEFEIALPNHLSEHLSVDAVIIDSMDDEYFLAVEHIKKQSIIGVSVEGIDISRHGDVYWLTISTSYCTFLFDVKQLGVEAFDCGLRDIMTDKTSEKVMHDCRRPSDCLFHLFNTEIKGKVFDTQLADFFVRMQAYDTPRMTNKVNDLDTCLKTYLHISECFLPTEQIHSRSEASFFQRPLSEDAWNYIIKNAVYLRLLRNILEDCMMNTFKRAVDVYVKSYKNSRSSCVMGPNLVSNEVPPELLSLQVASYQHTVKCSLINEDNRRVPIAQQEHCDNDSVDSDLCSTTISCAFTKSDSDVSHASFE